ncbi:hypothetical protein IAQ61_008887 [Plenodomus lingam]|nr:hypothetical protein IAQ61_008887 [Plenodomus lingam]
MHLFAGGWGWLVASCVLGQISGAVLPTPVITPAPQFAETGYLRLQDRQVDPISFAQVILTALPLSLRLIAATDVPAVSSILWSQFLDDNKPDWFLDLPRDVQSYLIKEFGPVNAWPTTPPPVASTAGASASVTVGPSPTSLASAQSSSSAVDSPFASYVSHSISIASSSSASSESSVGSTLQSIPSQLHSVSLATVQTWSSTITPSATHGLEAPALVESGLSRTQKIGLGVGVPFALLAIAALVFACCLLSHRRKRRHVNGNEPPSSPGFIPRFSFQDKGLSYEHHEHHAPLNPVSNNSNEHVGDMHWEDEEYEQSAIAASHRRDTFTPATATAQMVLHDTAPIMAPALFHTHSSNRARGRRTSYTSLQAVAEVAEPEDDMLESPILGRRQTRTGLRRASLPRIMNMPPTPPAGAIKRKPVPASPTESPAPDMASQSFQRPALAPVVCNSGSSSSGLAMSSISSNSGLSYESESPISAMNPQAPRNPFACGYEYLEDYGPEYSHHGYVDHEDGAYGGHRSLDRYPEASPRRGSLKTEWPLRNVLGSGYRRNKSPIWDRVYEP